LFSAAYSLSLRGIEKLRNAVGGSQFRREIGLLFRLHLEASRKGHHLENRLPMKVFTLAQIVWSPPPAAGPPPSAPAPFAALSSAALRRLA